MYLFSARSCKLLRGCVIVCVFACACAFVWAAHVVTISATCRFTNRCQTNPLRRSHKWTQTRKRAPTHPRKNAQARECMQ